MHWKQVFVAISICITPFSASLAMTGKSEYQVAVGGTSMSCLSSAGQPVRVRANPTLETFGRAFTDPNGKPVIELNLAAVSTFSPKLQQWWFAHECAHHQLPPQLNSEKRADCIAIKRVRNESGRLSAEDAAAFKSQLGGLAASSEGHLAGPERAAHVLKCAGALV